MLSISQTLASFGHVHHGASRQCFRCGKDLTDAASMEVGVGPVCRKLDNKVLAQQIPADIHAARAAFDAVELLSLPEQVVPTLVNVEADINEGALTDWRQTIKRIEWALSYPATVTVASNREALVKTVEGLGYVALATLWRGEGTTGECQITFEGSRLYLKGPRNVYANAKVKAIAGRTFDANSKRWSVPAAAHAALAAVVAAHYPNHIGLTNAVDAAKVYLQTVQTVSSIQPSNAAAPAPVAAPPAPAKKVSVTSEGGWLTIRSPYNVGFIADVKGIAGRKWNADQKVWMVPAAAAQKVAQMVAAHYGETVEALTPAKMEVPEDVCPF